MHANRKPLICKSCYKSCTLLNALYCDHCTLWVHGQCDHLNTCDVKRIKDAFTDYRCLVCCCSQEGEYDYGKALTTLSGWTKSGPDDASTPEERYVNLLRAATTESISLGRTPGMKLDGPLKNFNPNHHAVDQGAASLLRDFGTSTDQSKPVRTTGDGNCLFNALSLAKQGDEKLATQLRLRVGLEMILHHQAYIDAHPRHDSPWYGVCGEYLAAMEDAVRDMEWSTGWQLHAAATVLQRPIQSIYPPMNGILSTTQATLNTTLYPIRVTDEPALTRAAIKILWCGGIKKSVVWKPNHFVVILNYPEPTITVHDASPGPAWPIPILKPIPRRTRQTTIELHATSLPALPAATYRPSMPMESEEMREDHASEDTREDEVPEIAATSLPVRPATTYHPPMPMESEEKREDHASEETREDEVLEITPADFRVSSIDRRRLNVNDVYLRLQQVKTESDRFNQIPRGVKNNIGFPVNYTNNLHRKERGIHCDHWDDCGAWNRTTTISNLRYFTINSKGTPSSLVKKDGLFYCHQRQTSPVTPQPKEENILVLQRVYMSLKREPSYKKRIDWFVEGGQETDLFYSTAFVQYTGSYPLHKDSIHGNRKHGDAIYERTHLATLEKIRRNVKTERSNRRILTSLLVDDDAVDEPVDLKKVQNARAALRKEDPSNEGQRFHKKNIADDIQRLISHQTESNYLQEVIAAKDTPPCLILYTERQLEEIRVMARYGGVLGVDRTFNLGPAFVTVTTYKNGKVVRKTTDEPPILFGPMYIHWDGTYKTYHRFFSHLRGNLAGRDGTELQVNIVIGSDEERALTKAITQAFPEATLTLCTKHLQDNLRRHLDQKTTTDAKQKDAIKRAIFYGSNGLCSTNSLMEFDQRKEELRVEYEEDHPNFVAYFNALAEKLRYYVVTPSLDGKTPHRWTNNNAESVNHTIKQSITQWRLLALPDLVHELEREEKLQTKQLEMALTNRGDFCLAPKMYKFKCHPAAWDAMTKDEKTKRFTKFIKADIPKPKPTAADKKTLTSTNGELTINEPRAKVAKKPCQVTRPRCTRSTRRK